MNIGHFRQDVYQVKRLYSSSEFLPGKQQGFIKEGYLGFSVFEDSPIIRQRSTFSLFHLSVNWDKIQWPIEIVPNFAHECYCVLNDGSGKK